MDPESTVLPIKLSPKAREIVSHSCRLSNVLLGTMNPGGQTPDIGLVLFVRAGYNAVYDAGSLLTI
jgi:hypothetical protein